MTFKSMFWFLYRNEAAIVAESLVAGRPLLMCVDCKHIRHNTMCHRKGAASTMARDLVTGKVKRTEYEVMNCETEREENRKGYCTPDGIFFELHPNPIRRWWYNRSVNVQIGLIICAALTGTVLVTLGLALLVSSQ